MVFFHEVWAGSETDEDFDQMFSGAMLKMLKELSGVSAFILLGKNLPCASSVFRVIESSDKHFGRTDFM